MKVHVLDIQESMTTVVIRSVNQKHLDDIRGTHSRKGLH
jgi:hypothetical protein